MTDDTQTTTDEATTAPVASEGAEATTEAPAEEAAPESTEAAA